jgi:hypothetical protein
MVQMSDCEVVHSVDMAVGTTKSQLHKARLRLRKLLGRTHPFAGRLANPARLCL